MALLITVNQTQHDSKIFDCRSHLGDVDQGRRDFDAGHIPRAQHADLDKHLSAEPGNGGRHPLPDRQALEAQFQRWGVNRDDHIICYDQNSGAFAARLWWLFRWMGHTNVSVLDGGYDAWLAAKQQISTTGTQFEPGNFSAQSAVTRVCEVSQIANKDHKLLDARDAARYRGEIEPIDPVAGHIPGALSAPFTENLEAGVFKSQAELRQRFESMGIESGDQLVCYCGSGVTAIHNILALMLAGFAEPALYPGSWSEWITDPDRPIATG
jgi:thiosulfate/3-mercaptopyruvate sulfurtransferase